MNGYSEEIVFEIQKLEPKLKRNPMVVLKKIKEYDFGKLYHNQINDKYNPKYQEYKTFIGGLYSKYLESALETMRKNIESKDDYTLRGKIRDFALTFNDGDELKYVILTKLADDRSFEIILNECKNVLQTETDRHVNALPLQALLTFYELEKYTKLIHGFLLNSYEYTKLHALISKKYDYLKDNINSDIFLVVSQAITSLPEETRGKYYQVFCKAYEFASAKQLSYSMSQVSGYMAILSTAFAEKMDLAMLESSISITGKHYQENKFVFQTRYAKWYFENNCSEALVFIKKAKELDKIGYIAALLADLDCKESLPVLEDKLNLDIDPVSKEIFLEAIHRLKSQKGAPRQKDRMIWMFEGVSPTQRALGAASDNVFLKRAQEKNKLDDTVYETDEE